MKVFAVLALCTLAVAVVKTQPTEEEMEAFRAMVQRCKTENSATDDDIEGTIMHQSASSKEAKCMRACLMKEFGVMSADGKFVKEKALQIAKIHTKGNPEKMAISDEISSICAVIAVSDDHCEAAEQYGQCFAEESKKRSINTLDF